MRGQWVTSSISNALPSTPWGSDEVWLRTTFVSAHGSSLERLWLEFITDFATLTVYLNGQCLVQLDNPLKSPQNYRHVDVSDHVGAVRSGDNVLCVHAVAKEGSRGLDVGLYGV